MKEIKTELAVLGGGPGGYSGAFRAADLGKKVVLIEHRENLGGVCLNAGCIPSKTLLYIAHILDEAKRSSSFGVSFGSLQIDLDKIRSWKNSIIKKLSAGIKSLAEKRQVELLTGVGNFINPNQIEVVDKNGEKFLVSFKNAIIAAGSSSQIPSFVPEDPRIIDAEGALNLPAIPEEMLVIGGGIIGLEMATIYSSFGSKVTIVELTEQLLPHVDQDIVEPFKQHTIKKFHKIMLGIKVTKIETKNGGVWVTFDNIDSPQKFDHILVATGRTPNGKTIAAEKAGIEIDQKGFIQVNEKMQTNIPHIFAVGDITGRPMLAHKATFEGRIAAEVIAGLNPKVGPKYIPNVAYTNPEIALVGLNETEAKRKNIPYAKTVFPWLASGRFVSQGRKEGLTKLLFNPTSKKILGGAIVGPNAGELISEITLAISQEITAEEIAHVIHPHPTFSETIMHASELFLGTATDLNN